MRTLRHMYSEVIAGYPAFTLGRCTSSAGVGFFRRWLRGALGRWQPIGRRVAATLVLLAMILLLLCAPAQSEIIPVGRLYSAGWQSAGIAGGISELSTIHATIDAT